MSYEIIIKKRETKPVTKRGDYKVIERVPWGYAPNYESTETVVTEVLTQVVDELDIATVIRAINKL